LARASRDLFAGRDSYVRGAQLSSLLGAHRGQLRRVWSVNGKAVTLEFQGGGIAKSIDAFEAKHWETESAFDEFLRECRDLECPRPASYGSVFHAQFRSPKILHSFNYPFAPYFVGAWQGHAGAGIYRGEHHKYDLNSAYLWASTMGLPHPASFRMAERIGRHSGMFLVEHIPRNGLPYPFYASPVVLASTDEIEVYGLNVTRVIRGVTWTDYLDSDAVTSVMKRASFGKLMSRAYWGRWCSTALLECSNGRRSWYMRNHVLNIPWAHTLVSRVKMRVWEHASHAIHVFVDSIITTDKLPTGDKLGDWRLERSYPDGVKVRRAGFYGPASGEWERTSGEPKQPKGAV
jgi:hypothetical protein